MERPIQDASTHSDLTHFNDEGRARMVDVSDKSETERVACAAGTVHLNEDTLRRIEEGRIGKGKLIQPIAMEEGLGFAIREGGRTVGSGRVTKVIK